MFDLNRSTIAYPITIGGKDVIAQISWPNYEAAKRPYLASRFSVSPEADGVVRVNPADHSEFSRWLKDHIISLQSLDGRVIADEQRLTAIAEGPAGELLAAAVAQQFFSVADKDDDGESADDGEELDRLLAGIVQLDTTLVIREWEVERNEIVESEMLVGLHSMTVAQAQTLRKTIAVYRNNKTNETYTRPSTEKTEKLIRSLIVSIDGCQFSGKPCESSNKDEWIGLVPFHWLDEIARRLREVIGIGNPTIGR